MTVPVVESSSGHTGTGASSVVGDRPTGTTDGDLLVAFVVWGSSLSFSSAPSGWTLAGSESSGGGVKMRTYWKVASGEPATWTWTVSGATAGIVMVARVSGHDASTPIDTQSGTVDSTSDTTALCNGVTTGVADCLVLIGYAADSAVTFTPHASTTELQDLIVGSTRSAMMCWEGRPSAGATGGRSATMSAADRSLARCVSVQPGAAVAREPSLLLAV